MEPIRARDDGAVCDGGGLRVRSADGVAAVVVAECPDCDGGVWRLREVSDEVGAASVMVVRVRKAERRVGSMFEGMLIFGVLCIGDTGK